MNTNNNDGTGDNTIPHSSRQILCIPCSKIQPLPGQPRNYFNNDDLEALINSIRTVGQITPILVRKLNQPSGQFEYQLTDGERRLRACNSLNIDIMAMLDPEQRTDIQVFAMSVASNFGRASHTPLEVAQAIVRLKTEGKMPISEIASLFCKSVSWVNQYAGLANLNVEVQILLDPARTSENRRINVSTGFLLTGLPMPEQLVIAKQISDLGLDMARARALINKTLQGRGNMGKHRPDRELRRISSVAEKAIVALAGINELGDSSDGGTGLLKVIGNTDLQRCMQVVESLRGVAEHATKTAGKIEEALRLRRSSKPVS